MGDDRIGNFTSIYKQPIKKLMKEMPFIKSNPSWFSDVEISKKLLHKNKW